MAPAWRALTSVARAAERVKIATNFPFPDLIDSIEANCLKRFLIEFLECKAPFNILTRLSLLLVEVIVVLFQLIEQAENAFIDKLPELERRE